MIASFILQPKKTKRGNVSLNLTPKEDGCEFQPLFILRTADGYLVASYAGTEAMGKEGGGGVVCPETAFTGAVHVPMPVHALALGMLGVIFASLAGVLFF
jgi:hypothetical protein